MNKKMLEIDKWAQGKPLFVAIWAQQFATSPESLAVDKLVTDN
jgi:hypothetical protein